MRNFKKGNFYFKILILVSVLIFGILANSNAVYADQVKYYLGGNVAGFVLDEKGAYVLAVTDIVTNEGMVSPAEDSGIKNGDLILSLNGENIDKAQDIDDFLAKFEGGEVIVELQRKNEKVLKNIKPQKDLIGNYKIGLIIRDALTGIGTITFYTSEGDFSALGHPIYSDKNSIFDLSSGKIYPSSVIGVYKGKKGTPGEIKGVFTEEDALGEITSNSKVGIKGRIKKEINGEEIELGKAEIGKAHIYCCTEGTEVKKYSASIIKCDSNNKQNKNLVIKITDKELLDKTGGIIQGMSGSPIVQNGKLIGAVTHVFINDPTRGYGISVNNLISNK